MKLVTAADADGRTFPGIYDAGGIVDLSQHGFATALDVISADASTLVPIVDTGGDVMTDATLKMPLVPRRIIGTGTNYRSHVAEMGGTEPQRPTANFIKLPNSYAAAGDDIEIPPFCLLDYEAEIAIVIGTEVSHADSDAAYQAIFGLCLANDLSARDAPTTHLSLAKSGNGFCPIGPWITTTDELDVADIAFELLVNGELRQDSNSSDMIHSMVDIVASFSHSLPLHPGDVILTGSPSGVGVGQNPPVFLAPGDIVEIRSPQLGTMANRLVSPATVEGKP